MSEIKWRRKWKPNLNSCSWQKLQVHSTEPTLQNMLVKAKFSDSSYEFLATNLTEFWYEKVDGNMLQKRNKVRI